MFGDNVGGVLFWDAGNVYSRLRDISLRYRPAAHHPAGHHRQGVSTDGNVFGLQLHGARRRIRHPLSNPVGPIRLDLAFSPTPRISSGCAGYQRSTLLDCGRFDASNRPLVPSQNDRISPFQFHFSIGQAF